jgi:hypothetical protein
VVEPTRAVSFNMPGNEIAKANREKRAAAEPMERPENRGVSDAELRNHEVTCTADFRTAERRNMVASLI